jgi:tetratricopeptide (TPR) repeat protein
MRLFFFLLILFSTSSLKAQTPVPQHQSKSNQSAQSQRQINDKLARNFFNNKEYDKAADLYQQLYVDYRYYYYFSQYIECLIFLERFDEAEKDLKSFIKNDNTTNKWRSNVSLAYVLFRNNEKDKSDKILKKLINELPADKNVFIQVANEMRAKDFNEFAIMLYDRGSGISSMDYKFFMEKALAYQSMMDFGKATENYLLQLEEKPDDYEVVKSRMSYMLRYNVDDSVIDDMRFALLKKAQENRDNENFAELLVWFALQMKDYEIALDQEIALDRRFDDREYDVIYLAKIARDNEQYDIAIRAYDYLIKKSTEGVYYEDAVVGMTEVQYQKVESSFYEDSKTEFYSEFEKRIEKECLELGVSDKTIPILIIRAEILASRLNEIEKSIEILNDALPLNISRLNKAKIKMKLADIYLFKEEVWEATLLYSQVDKSMKEEPIGHEARFKNAQLRYYIGEFDWALSVLNILKSATSKLIANDAMTLSLVISDNLEYDTIALQRLAKADFYIYQKRYELANQMLDSINIYNPNEVSMPYLLMRKAHIAMENNDYEMADSLYKRVYQGYADSYMADDALMKDAILLEKTLDKKEEALECYAKLIDEYASSVYVAQARNAYRRIRN